MGKVYLLAVTDTAETVFGDSSAKDFRKISLVDNTV
jgi:hypothetical protein